MLTLRLPKVFLDDHLSLDPVPGITITKTLAREYDVTMTELAADDLWSRARYYSSTQSLDPEHNGLRASASATFRRMARHLCLTCDRFTWQPDKNAPQCSNH